MLDACYDVLGRDTDAVAHDNEWTVVDRGLVAAGGPRHSVGGGEESGPDEAAGSESSFQTDDATPLNVVTGECQGGGNSSRRPSPPAEVFSAEQEPPLSISATLLQPLTPKAVGMYEEALALAESGAISCRRVRVQETGSCSRLDFLARLHCIRQASSIMLADAEVRAWFQQTGREMLAALLAAAGQATQDFAAAFDGLNRELVARVGRLGVDTALEEYAQRGVTDFTYFDLVLDYYILDAFDDIKKLPHAATAIIGSRWVPLAVKQKV